MKEKERITFKGIDGWNRPIFQSLTYKRNFYGSTDKLFNLGATEEHVLKEIKTKDLVFFGNTFGCEPMGTPAKNLKIIKSRALRIKEASPLMLEAIDTLVDAWEESFLGQETGYEGTPLEDAYKKAKRALNKVINT